MIWIISIIALSGFTGFMCFKIGHAQGYHEGYGNGYEDGLSGDDIINEKNNEI